MPTKKQNKNLLDLAHDEHPLIADISAGFLLYMQATAQENCQSALETLNQ